MPEIRNGDLQNALQGIRSLQQERLPALVGVKLRKIRRALQTAFEDVEEERLKLLQAHAVLDEDDEPKAGESGSAIFISRKEERLFENELKELHEGTVEIEEVVKRSDLQRKERDEKGKVSETDDLHAIIIDQLGDLFVEDK